MTMTATASDDRPVHLHIPLREDLIQAEDLPSAIDVAVKSDIMQSFENQSLLHNDGHILSLVAGQRGIVTFSIGRDHRLYLIRKAEEQSAFWRDEDVSAKLFDRFSGAEAGAGKEVVSFHATHGDGDAVTLVCCVAQAGDPGRNEIFVAEKVNLDRADETDWRSLGSLPGRRVETLRVIAAAEAYFQTTGERYDYIASVRKTGDKHIDSFRYAAGTRTWKFLQPTFDNEGIIDIQFGKTPSLGAGLYMLYRWRNKRHFNFIEMYDEGEHVALRIAGNDLTGTTLVNPGPFAVDVIAAGEDAGFTEVYLADEVNPGKNVVRYLDVDAQDESLAGNPGWRDLAKDLPGQAREVFFTRNDAGRMDVYVHTTDGDGTLLHFFRNETTKNWSPAYVLQRGIRRLAPASNRQGRICELFAIGASADDLLYLWQDEKHFSWGRDRIKVRAGGKAVAVDAAQTRITFSDPRDGSPILFQRYENPGKITISSSMAASVRINNVMMNLDAGAPVELNPKTLVDGIEIVVILSEADTPFFTLRAGFLAGGQLVVYPVNKVKDDMSRADKKNLLAPTDRYGDPLRVRLVDGEQARPEYLDGVLPGMNEVAGFHRKSSGANFLSLLASPPDLPAMTREGVWYEAAGPLDTTVDLEALPEGYMFAIDFSGPEPRFLDSAACRAQGLEDIPIPEWASWDDLAKFFGAFVEAVKNAFEKVVKFVAKKVEEGIQFAIHFAGEVVQCLVKTVEQAMKTVNMVLKKYLGIDLEKILQWVGFVFDIGDMRAAQKMLANEVGKGFAKMKDVLRDSRSALLAQLDEVRRGLTEGRKLFDAAGLGRALAAGDAAAIRAIFQSKGLDLGANFESRQQGDGTWMLRDEQQTYVVRPGSAADEVRVIIKLPNSVEKQTPAGYKGQVRKDYTPHLGRNENERARNRQVIQQRGEDMRHDPVLHWIGSQFKQLPSLGLANIFEFDLSSDIRKRIERFFIEEIQKPLESAAGTLMAKVDGLVKTIQDTNKTLADLFDYVNRNLLDFGLELARNLISAIFRALADCTEVLERIVTGGLNIPVIKDLFQLICPGVTFNVINVLSLVAAVPSVVIMKLSGVKFTALDSANSPAILRHVLNWAQLVLNFLGTAATTAMAVANWFAMAPADEARDAEVALGPAAACGNMMACVAMAVQTMTASIRHSMFGPKPEPSKGEWVLWEWRMELSVIISEAVDLVFSALIVGVRLKTGAKVAAAIMSVYGTVFGVAYAALQLTLGVFRTIVRAIKKDVWLIVEGVLGFFQALTSQAARVLVSIGNLIPREGYPAIAKGIVHAAYAVAGWGGLIILHVPRTIGNTFWLHNNPNSVESLSFG